MLDVRCETEAPKIIVSAMPCFTHSSCLIGHPSDGNVIRCTILIELGCAKAEWDHTQATPHTGRYPNGVFFLTSMSNQDQNLAILSSNPSSSRGYSIDLENSLFAIICIKVADSQAEPRLTGGGREPRFRLAEPITTNKDLLSLNLNPTNRS